MNCLKSSTNCSSWSGLQWLGRLLVPAATLKVLLSLPSMLRLLGHTPHWSVHIIGIASLSRLPLMPDTEPLEAWNFHDAVF